MINTLTITLYISLAVSLLFIGLSIYYFLHYDIITIYKEHKLQRKIKKETFKPKESKPKKKVIKQQNNNQDHTTLINEDESTTLMTSNSTFDIVSIEIISDLNKNERSKFE